MIVSPSRSALTGPDGRGAPPLAGGGAARSNPTRGARDVATARRSGRASAPASFRAAAAARRRGADGARRAYAGGRATPTPIATAEFGSPR